MLSNDLLVQPSNTNTQKSYSLAVPGSKSISNRVLFLAAMASGTCRITGLLRSEDTAVMLKAIADIGAKLQWDGVDLLLTGTGGHIQGIKEIYAANAGTATRFLTVAMCLIKDAAHCTTILGSERAQARPQTALIKALRENGMRVESLHNNGCIPLRVFGGGFKGGKMLLEGKISSQYVSAILLSAPFADKPLDLTLVETNPTSLSFIEMTLQNMREFGIEVQRPAINRFIVPNTAGYKAPVSYAIEGDATSATYALASAALRPDVCVTITNVGSTSLQSDAKFFKLLEKMGCKVKQTVTTTMVTGATKLKSLGTINMADLTDAFLTMAIVAAFAEGTTEIVGIDNQHQKECDRIAAMVCEFAKCGVRAENLPDGIRVFGREAHSVTVSEATPIIETYDDHRIAMAFSLFGLRRSVVILNKECTAKTYPEYWKDASNFLGFNVDNYTLENSIKNYANKSIVIIGMRGAGKSSCAKATVDVLSQYMETDIKWELIDLDRALETELKLSCAEIVRQYGWEGFRTKETKLLQSILHTKPLHTVIACGGGVIETQSARESLKTYQGPVVYIDRSISDIEQDLQTTADNDARPDYAGETISTVYKRRLPWFKECSTHDFVIPVKENDWQKIGVCFGELCRSFQVTPTPDIARSGYIIVSDFAEQGDGVIVSLNVARARVSLAQRPVIIRVTYVTHVAIAARLAPAYICLETYFDPDPKDLVEALKLLGNSTKLILVGALDIEVYKAAIGTELWNRIAAVWKDVESHIYDEKLDPCITPTKLYLFGAAISGSPSPVIHNTASKDLKLGFEYQICDTRDPAKLLWLMNSPSFKGASVTMPYKQMQFGKVMLSPEAKAIGAVNTLVKTTTGEIHAHNTDWIGIKSCLERSMKYTDLSKQTALVVGAGGTAMAAVYCLLQMGFSSIMVYNRTQSKAEKIVTKFGAHNVIAVVKLETISNIAVIISTIPAAAKFALPMRLFALKPVVLDAAYKIDPHNPAIKIDTTLINQAMAHGCVTYRGIDMLLEQGFEQLKLWGAGRNIPTNTMCKIRELCL